MQKTNGEPVRFEVLWVRSRRARHLRLSVNRHHQARLSVPWTCSKKRAMEFLQGHTEWLMARLEHAAAHASLGKYLRDHPYLTGGGRLLRFSCRSASTRPFYLHFPESREIHFCLRAENDPEEETVRLARKFAAEVIPERVRELAFRHGLSIRRISVRDQSSRWGSCSTAGTVSLNWRLILLEPDVQDHIILHELAHLTEMNHSGKFWALLRSYDPRTLEHNACLNPAAEKLMSLGRSQRRGDPPRVFESG